MLNQHTLESSAVELEPIIENIPLHVGPESSAERGHGGVPPPRPPASAKAGGRSSESPSVLLRPPAVTTKPTVLSSTASLPGAKPVSPGVRRASVGASSTPRRQSGHSPHAQRGATCDSQHDSLRHTEISWDELNNLTYVTQGAMCEIHTAEYRGQKVVVKIPRKDCEDPQVAEHDLEVELDVLQDLDHKHIIKLVGAGYRPEKPQRFLVLEYLELGTLAEKLDKGEENMKKSRRFAKFHVVTMIERAMELAWALEYLHHEVGESTFVVHRDLKPDNVGFKADGTLKLFDFGLARVVKRRSRMNARYDMTGETGSMRYMAPEVVESLPYNEKVDVYAFGLLLWEMLQLTRVFDGMSISEFYGRVINGGARPPLDPSWPADIKKLISQCWHADVDRRPNFHQIAERLATVFSEEKGADKIAMSALNLADGVDVKGLLTANSAKRLVRSSTTTNIVPSSKSRGTGGGSGSGEGDEKKKRGFLGKLGKILGGKKGPSAATLVHTAPEAANAQKSQSHGQRSLSSSQIAVPASLANLK